MNSMFRPHGKFHTHVEGRLIISVVSGPWNRELVLQWRTQTHPYARAAAASGPHVGIAEIRDSMLCPPDAMETLREAIVYGATELNCIMYIIVADPAVEGRNFVEPLFARLYEGVVPHAIVNTLDAARALARQALMDAGY